MTTTRPALRLLAVAILACSSGLTAQAQITNQIYWNFNSPTPTSGVPGGWTVGSLVQGNNNGTTTLFTTTSASSGYTNQFGVAASGTTNAGAAARTNALNTNASGSAYFEFSIVPAVTNTNVVITNVSFGTRSTSTGPQAYTLRSSSDNFSTDLATDTIPNSGTWVLRGTNALLSVAVTNGTNTFRIYGYNGTGTPSVNTANWRIDDLTVALGEVAGPGAPVVTSFAPTSGAAGTAVSIVGSNFTGATAVAFNGVSATFSNVTATNLSATVPSGALTGPISVTTSNGTGASTNNFMVPTITVVMPASVVEGSTNVTGEVTVNEAPVSDLTVTLTSSSPADLTVEPTVTIFASTTNSTFNFTAPLDSTIDSDTNVTVTPSAAGWAGVPDTITVVNVDAVKIPLTNFTTNSYTQNFDSLGTVTFSNVISSTNGVQTGLGSVVSTNLNGWFAAKIFGTGTSPTGIVADDGTNNSSSVYNYGATGDTNRSLGGLASGTTVPAFGALLENNTGTTINSIIINLTGKFWRSSSGGPTNGLTFGYGLVDGVTVNNNNFISVGGASALPAANVVGPAPVPASGPLNGNDPTNQVLLSNVVIPVTLAPGGTMFIRWQDFNEAGNDAGLAIDDLSLTASTNLPAPSVAGVTVNPFALTEAQSEVSSAVISDGGSTLTSRGFVYSETFFNTNPVIGGPNTTAITNDPPDVSAFTNTITGLLASTGYSVRSFAINAQGTNYSAIASFNTLAPNPAFTGVYTQSFNGLTNTDFPSGWRCLSTSNINNYAGDWNATNSIAAGFYGRTNIPGILGYLHTASTGILSNRLTLVNNTGGTLTNLWVSYQGEVNVLNPTSNLRFPEWTVVVQGQTNAALAYSTAGGVSSNLVAEITGLSIPNGSNIVISWSSDRGFNTTNGASRLIGMTDVRVATNAPSATPTINVTGSFTNFVTTVGVASPSQSLTVSGSDLTTNITVTTPAYYQASTDNTNFTFVPVELVPSGGTVTNTTIYFRLFATNYVGNANGTVFFDSVPATLQTAPVTGVVNGSFDYWLAGAPTNSANLLKYAIGGATSPTATNGVPSQTAVTSSNLSITAIVRTNDPSLSVFGEGLTNLNVAPWSTNGITTTVSTNQLDVPTGNQRQIFSIPRGTNASQFLRLDSVLQP